MFIISDFDNRFYHTADSFALRRRRRGSRRIMLVSRCKASLLSREPRDLLQGCCKSIEEMPSFQIFRRLFSRSVAPCQQDATCCQSMLWNKQQIACDKKKCDAKQRLSACCFYEKRRGYYDFCFLLMRRR